LSELAATMRAIVTTSMVKGEMSQRLTKELPEHHLRYCKPCDAIHPHEQAFRIAAIQAGLELTPGTSPPLVRRIKGMRPNGFRRPGSDTAPRFNIIRNYLRFYGPATAKEVASFVDAPVKDIGAHWPEDVVDVDVDGLTKSALADTLDVLSDPPQPTAVRLAGPFDPLLQGRDRELLVPDAGRRKTVWRALGRPGVVFVAAEPIGTWRSAKAGNKLRVTLDLWTQPTQKQKDAIVDETQRLADFRGIDLLDVAGL
jgi:hypothetical protein